ncbi:MAG: hypothetical protein LBD23_19160 [Oscillospiraceae bacterium]|jgi:hypothetical protein|nr:hypothetical protein [Oscillospiraceae bacterium]
MQNIIIDEEFESLLPKLDETTFETLENNLLEYGVRDALVLWNDILIDGYNRYKICTKHNVPFNTVNMEFNSREEVLMWISNNQIARRNLTPVQLSHYRGVYYNAVKKMKGSSNQYTAKSANPQSEGEQSRSATARDVGKRFNVSRATIERDGKVASALNEIAKVSPEAKRKILSGEIPVDRAKLQRLSNASKAELKEVVTQINAGTYNRNDYRNKKTPDSIPDTTPLPLRSETNYVDTIVSLITGNVNTTIQLLSNESGVPELKTSLRALINTLEELYSNITTE